jgi:allantoinase
VRPAAVAVTDGVITDVTAPAAAPAARERWDEGDAVLLPGLVDTHVHVNEPGRTEWEGWATATRAAAAGGVTTIVDMPLNSSPVTTTVAALAAKVAAAQAAAIVDFGLWGGAVPGDTTDLGPLHAAGVLGFKAFLVDSGIAEFAALDPSGLDAAMRAIAPLGSVLLAHAELPGPIARAAATVAGRDPRRYATWLASRPPAAELEAIRLVTATARATGCRAHVVHLSAADGAHLVVAARRDGVAVTVETCPHYLTFAAEEVPDGATEYKCAPPVRETANRERLWAALAGGDIDLVASDHSPCPPQLKRPDTGDFLPAWGGIASLELLLPATWTGARARGQGVAVLARWLAAAPARLAGIGHRKGAIAVGLDADLVAFDPDAEWTVDRARLRHRHAVTPYHGRRLRGRVRRTWVRGRCVFDGSAFPPGARGQWLRRGAA